MWNWLSGFLLGIPLGLLFVKPKLDRLEASPEDESLKKAYIRAVAINHLIDHTGTVLGVALLVFVAVAAGGANVWLSCVVGLAYILIWRLPHIIDAAERYAKADHMPAASDM